MATRPTDASKKAAKKRRASAKAAKKKPNKKKASKKSVTKKNAIAKKPRKKRASKKKATPKKTGKKKASKKKTSARRTPSSSPLFRSAMEVLEHGLWHYFRSDTATDLKFAIMHVDQAVELLMKECVRKNGKSIYKNPKETISLWGAYQILQDELDVSIPEKPDLELLHEERNNVQHKYLNPSAEDANFHVTNGLSFIVRFVSDQLKLDMYEHVPSDYIDELLGEAELEDGTEEPTAS